VRVVHIGPKEGGMHSTACGSQEREEGERRGGVGVSIVVQTLCYEKREEGEVSSKPKVKLREKKRR